MSQKLLIASTNKGKLREFQAIFPADLPMELILPANLGLVLEVDETGYTYAENAILKAKAYSQRAPVWVLADDSGLEVDALDGEPGIYSARYAPWEGATDADRRRYLIQNLIGKPRPWTAHFHCSIAIAGPDGQLHVTEGDVYGEIIPEERGSNGFGYDPLFYIPELGMTTAEIPEAQKNRISHRALAALAAVPFLRKIA